MVDLKVGAISESIARTVPQAISYWRLIIDQGAVTHDILSYSTTNRVLARKTICILRMDSGGHPKPDILLPHKKVDVHNVNGYGRARCNDDLDRLNRRC